MVIAAELLGQVLGHIQVLLGGGVRLADQLLELRRADVPHRVQFGDHVAVLDDLHPDEGHVELFALLGFFKHPTGHLQRVLSGLLGQLSQLLRNLLALALPLLSKARLAKAILSDLTAASGILRRTALAGLVLTGLSKLSLAGQRLADAILSGLNRLLTLGLAEAVGGALSRLQLSRAGGVGLAWLGRSCAALTARLQLFQFLVHLLVVLDQLLGELLNIFVFRFLDSDLTEFNLSLIAQHHLLDEEVFDALIGMLTLLTLNAASLLTHLDLA